jgi:hypothetical protein
MPGFSSWFLTLSALAAQQADAFWRLPCGAPVSVERADPLVQPDAVAGHVHTIMGSNGFNYTMAPDFAEHATCTTCKAVEDLSAYWIPNLYYQNQNGSFTQVEQMGGALIYYLQRQDERDPLYGKEGLLAFPENLRMFAGDPLARNFTGTVEAQAVSFACLGVDGPETNEMPPHNCPNGLRAQLNFPSCWDGENLDSPDHKSHVVYPSRKDSGHCPESHPHRFISLFYEVLFNVNEFKDMWWGDRQPFVFSNGDPTGYGFHGDFVNGWDRPTLQTAIDTCTSDSGVIEECKAFTLQSNEDMNSCRVLSHIDEDVTGTLPALPGCNPVESGPEPATKAMCADTAAAAPQAAATLMPEPLPPFTDALAMGLAWKYLACARDPAGQPRTLGAASDRGDHVTVETCLDFCAGRGFAYAGVEYASECYCGGAAPAQDRLWRDGLLGSCEMPCAGNSTQKCGGAAQIGIYQRCPEGQFCENMDLGSW